MILNRVKHRLVVGFMAIFWIVLFFVPNALADTVGDRRTFFVNSLYDASSRTSISASLINVSSKAYFYVEDGYTDKLSSSELTLFNQRLQSLAQEFDNVIYPKETEFWGSEPNPGIDKDPRIAILVQRLTPSTGGYFDTVNGYSLAQVNNSNQREMITISIDTLGNSHVSSFLSHEFQHLISFNQKELLRDTTEEIWLNELRSQYAVTVAGYNQDFRNSDLSNRLRSFLDKPTDSLTEWMSSNLDYAPVTLFGHYLVDRFGPSILQETLHGSSNGIDSINAYLSSRHQFENFSDIFADWEWATYFNNQAQDSRYGYTNPSLKYIQVSPTELRQLNASGPNMFSYSLKPWQPMWNQFILDSRASASKNIKFSWQGSGFQVSYADASGVPRLLNNGDVVTQSKSGFVLMPTYIAKTSGFGNTEPSVPLALTIEYTDQPTTNTSSVLKDGALIAHAGTPDTYVIWGTYKRYLAPEVLKFYGLENIKVNIVPEAVFQSYMPSNYIRAIDEKKVYAVWPDGTKHWLNMTAQTFTDSYRDWNSVFIVNNLESNFYRIGADIKN
ncbi:MAG: hypothetical protein AAB638_00565 [Patescibacteria group bacterium]